MLASWHLLYSRHPHGQREMFQSFRHPRPVLLQRLQCHIQPVLSNRHRRRLSKFLDQLLPHHPRLLLLPRALLLHPNNDGLKHIHRNRDKMCHRLGLLRPLLRRKTKPTPHRTLPRLHVLRFPSMLSDKLSVHPPKGSVPRLHPKPPYRQLLRILCMDLVLDGLLCQHHPHQSHLVRNQRVLLMSQ